MKPKMWFSMPEGNRFYQIKGINTQYCTPYRNKFFLIKKKTNKTKPLSFVICLKSVERNQTVQKGNLKQYTSVMSLHEKGEQMVYSLASSES